MNKTPTFHGRLRSKIFCSKKYPWENRSHSFKSSVFIPGSPVSTYHFFRLDGKGQCVVKYSQPRKMFSIFLGLPLERILRILRAFWKFFAHLACRTTTLTFMLEHNFQFYRCRSDVFIVNFEHISLLVLAFLLLTLNM